MDEKELNHQIVIAILANDKDQLKQLKDKLARQRWIKQFNGNIPPIEWLKPNPFIKFED